MGKKSKKSKGKGQQAQNKTTNQPLHHAAGTGNGTGNGAGATPSISLDEGTNTSGSMRELQEKLFRYQKTMLALPPETIVEDIRRGKDIPTQAVIQLSGTLHEDNEYRRRLVDAGMVEAVLGLLKRCIDEEFMHVLTDIGGEECEDGSLAFPSIWINVLLNTTCNNNLLNDAKMDECRLLVANNIGPLVQCMIDDSKREFFKSNMLWHGGISYFATLLRNLILTSETVPILLQYEGLADMMIQSMFWEAHRPDIVDESKSYGTFIRSDNFSMIEVSAGFVVTDMADVNGKFDEEGRKRLDFLARTPIVSNVYNNTGANTIFAVGLTQLLGSKTASVQKDHVFWILNQFVFSGLVDSDVIKGLVIFGKGIDSYDDAEPVVGAVFNMIVTGSQTRGAGPQVPNDSRCAVAIENGLFEVILRILTRFRFEVNDDLIFLITNMLNGASAVALMKRSSVAIENCRGDVLRLLRMIDQNVSIEHKCLGIVQSIRSIVTQSAADGDAQTAACRRCYKTLQDKEKKKCTGCKRAIYCSRECQVLDWKTGHKRDCKHMAIHAEQMKMAGQSKKNIKKAEQHEKNVSMAGNKAFMDNTNEIVMRAIFQGCSILDCVVIIDFLQTPPPIELTPAAEFLSDCKENSGENYSHTKRVVERNRSSGNVTVACHSLGVYRETDAAGNPATSVLLKTFPGVGAPFGSWAVYQEKMETDMPEHFSMYKEDEVLREDFLREMRTMRRSTK